MHRNKFSAILWAGLIAVLLTLTFAGTAWAAEYRVLYKFMPRRDAQKPSAGLIFDAAGNLYGTSEYGGAGRGTAFKLTPSPDGRWTETLLHNFAGDNNDGEDPRGNLIFDAAGNLYGTTRRGGPRDRGTAFKLAPNPDGTWTESLLHSFNDTDGKYPVSGLVFDTAGDLYGTTEKGGDGSYHLGVVFKLAPNPDGTWTESVLHTFNALDGEAPSSSLIFDAAGNLYGTILAGGNASYGVAFELKPDPDGSWTEIMLHGFSGNPDGAFLASSLIFDAAGDLYGTTVYGGRQDYGMAFKLTPNPDGSWKESKLHSFKGTDGANPYAGLISDAAGGLYGTTYAGGVNNLGTVFKLAPNPDGTWKRTTLHTFKGKEGANPRAGLILDANGSLYGTTLNGGNGYGHGNQKGFGVVFEITP